MEKEQQTRTASWINVIAGIWLIIAPFVLGYCTTAARWNDVVLGIIIAAMSLWSLVSTQVEPARHGQARA